jgi:hypothetical protein
MRKFTNWTVSKESAEDMLKAGRHNPCLEIRFRDRKGWHTQKISAGYGDELHVYRERGKTYLLSRNWHLGYMGLEVFRGDEKAGDLFLEHHEVVEIFGEKELSPGAAISKLVDYIC